MKRSSWWWIGEWTAQVARDLDIGQNVISRRVREAKADKAHAFPGCGVMKPEDSEIARLKRELAKTRAELDILKKPLGSSSKSRREIRGDCPAARGMAIEMDV